METNRRVHPCSHRGPSRASISKRISMASTSHPPNDHLQVDSGVNLSKGLQCPPRRFHNVDGNHVFRVGIPRG